MTTENYGGQMVGNTEPNRLADTPIPPSHPDRAYQVEITQLDHGYMVRVGCKQFAFETKDKMIKKIDEYLSDVPGVTSQFFNKTLDL